MTWERTSEVSVVNATSVPATGTYEVGERPIFFFVHVPSLSVGVLNAGNLLFRVSRIDGSVENIQKRYVDITGRNVVSSVTTSRADNYPISYFGSVHTRLGKSPIILYRHTVRSSGGNLFLDRVVSMSAGMLTAANRLAFTARNATIKGFIFEDV